jgi:hypothetical protein
MFLKPANITVANKKIVLKNSNTKNRRVLLVMRTTRTSQSTVWYNNFTNCSNILDFTNHKNFTSCCVLDHIPSTVGLGDKSAIKPSDWTGTSSSNPMILDCALNKENRFCHNTAAQGLYDSTDSEKTRQMSVITAGEHLP